MKVDTKLDSNKEENVLQETLQNNEEQQDALNSYTKVSEGILRILCWIIFFVGIIVGLIFILREENIVVGLAVIIGTILQSVLGFVFANISENIKEINSKLK